MSEIRDRIASLPPEKRALFAHLLESGNAEDQIPRQRRDSNIFPMSFAQERMWFFYQWEPGNPLYNGLATISLQGPLDVDAYERAIVELTRRHEILRTVFGAGDPQPAQIILSEHPDPLRKLDLSDAPENRGELDRLIAAEAGRPFDLAAEPGIRSLLVKLGAEEFLHLIAFHHIATDAWSIGMLFDELGSLYCTIHSGTALDQSVPAIQYVDFAVWQRAWLQGRVLKDHLSYWKEKLAAPLPRFEFPSDRTRTVARTFRGGRIIFDFGVDLTTRLKTQSQRHSVTPFMTMLAAFYVLLHRYVGDEDLIVGSPIANRYPAQTRNILGLFTNTLVLRAGVNGRETFRALLGRIKALCLEAYTHQYLPFEKLVEEIQPPRDEGRTPLFQVMFAMENVMAPVLDLPGIKVSVKQIDTGTSAFDLTLNLRDGGDGLGGYLEFSEDLFEKETATRVCGHFRNLLRAIAEDPEQQVSDLPMLSADELSQVLLRWNDTQMDGCAGQTIDRLFAAQAKRTPDAIAVVAQGRISYGELDRRAESQARRLAELGVGCESAVGICVERSIEMIVAVLGVWKAGGFYVPIDPDYPASRVALLLEDARASVLVESAPNAIFTTPPHVKSLPIDSSRPAEEDCCGGDSHNHPDPESLAYVIYTSGSTGRPKGVMISHRSAVNLAAAHQMAIYGNHPDVGPHASLNAPFTFDGCVERMLLLLSGRTLVLIPEDTRRDPYEFVSLARKHSLDVLDLTPSQLKPLTEAGLLRGGDAAKRLVLVGGEPIERTLWARLAEQSDTYFYNVYGPTECTINASVCRIGRETEGPVIGRPLGNVQIYILDRYGNPAPHGVVGEMFVGGEGVARGYLGNPAVTAEKFVPDCFSARPGARLYTTADKARYLADGSIEFHGRADHQVKVRGFRIELGEIESALREFPGVDESVARTKSDGAGDSRIVAFAVPAFGKQIDDQDVRHFLKTRLPEYMIPSSIVVLDSFPLLSNGKIDYQALSESDATKVRKREFVAPRTSTEKTLAGVWSDVLKAGEISINDGFFDLGGHSLSATQALIRIKQAFGVKLPLRVFFEAGTLADLALKIVEAQLKQEYGGKIEQVLRELEGLSEDAARLAATED